MSGVNDLFVFAKDNGILLQSREHIALEAAENIRKQYKFSVEDIKKNFDELIYATQSEAYRLYLDYEAEFGRKVLDKYAKELEKDSGHGTKNLGLILAENFKLLDKFFLSLAQSRKSRAGRTFEDIQNALFKQLGYPFDEQIVINGKPDFLMPSVKHYQTNPMDCIIFTAKRTLRERWRQIVTEGTKGYGFFLATIDDEISDNQLREMQNNKIYVVCPKVIKDTKYVNKVNVFSYEQFFVDHLDPSMERWRRNGII